MPKHTTLSDCTPQVSLLAAIARRGSFDHRRLDFGVRNEDLKHCTYLLSCEIIATNRQQCSDATHRFRCLRSPPKAGLGERSEPQTPCYTKPLKATAYENI